MRTYRLNDLMTHEECERFGVPSDRALTMWWASPKCDGISIMAVHAGEFRTPCAGEWYLSGAKPAAWRAPNDLSTKFHIMRLVKVKRETRVIETLVENSNA